jgi:PAS domain-containing protein
MSQKELEIILSRHLASRLAMPILIVDSQSVLLFFNEPAERILGRRFEEEVQAAVWATVCVITDEAGNLLPPDSNPLLVALATGRPAHGRFWIHSLDGVQRHIETVTLPINGQSGRFLGGMALFWEVGADSFAAAQVDENSVSHPSKTIELILARQLASCLAIAMMIYDLQGTLIFYNESAELILGERFDETGEILVVDLARLYNPTDEKGRPLGDRSPTRTAHFQRRPAHKRFWIRGRDGVRRSVEVSAFPLIDPTDRFLGVIGLMWEVSH